MHRRDPRSLPLHMATAPCANRRPSHIQLPSDERNNQDMTVRGRPPHVNRGPRPRGYSGSPEPAQPGPLLPQRTVLILIAAVVIGIATGTLTYLAYHLLAEAILAGGAASGAAIPALHRLIG